MAATRSAIRNRLDRSAGQKLARIGSLTRPLTGGLNRWVSRRRKPVLRSILVQPRPIHTRLALASHRMPLPRPTRMLSHGLPSRECPPRPLDGQINQAGLLPDQGHVTPPSAFSRWLRYAPSDSRHKPNSEGLAVEQTCYEGRPVD